MYGWCEKDGISMFVGGVGAVFCNDNELKFVCKWIGMNETKWFFEFDRLLKMMWNSQFKLWDDMSSRPSSTNIKKMAPYLGFKWSLKVRSSQFHRLKKILYFTSVFVSFYDLTIKTSMETMADRLQKSSFLKENPIFLLFNSTIFIYALATNVLNSQLLNWIEN